MIKYHKSKKKLMIENQSLRIIDSTTDSL